MSITFGSVGDIIAVGQIAWSLAKALTDSKGSAKEYQGLIKELQTFDQALLQVVALWQNYESSPELDKLGTITKDAVKDWRDTLLAFRVKVDKKYGSTLVVGGSGNWMKDAGKRVIWLKEKEDILDLRRKLGSASDTITMLTLAAMGKSNRLAESTIAFRVQAVHCLLQESKKLAEEHVAQLKAIDEKIEMQSKTSDLILSHVESGIVSLTQVHSMTIDIKNILGLFQSHLLSQQSTPRGLGTGWQQDPVTLEDALGFRIPIPLELVNSWEMLDMILLKRFEKRPGHQKVLKGEYAIEEGTTGRDVNRENELLMCFRPGQKIDMSMVFSDLDANSNHCPRCGTKSEASAEARTQCTSCRMWFQRLVEIEDESEPESITELTERPAGVRSGVSTKKPKLPASTPAEFQRVRLMSTLRPREQKLKEERDKAYARRLEEELCKAGLDQTQIDVVLKGDVDIESNRPTFTRMPRRYLAIETLDRYSLDYEFDEDPDYVLIKGWVPEYEQDFPWKQTRELREKRDKAQRESGEMTKPLGNHKIELQDILDEVDNIATRMASRPASVMTDYGDDDKEIWKQVRRELISVGFSSEVLLQHQNALRAYLREIGGRGNLVDVPTDPQLSHQGMDNRVKQREIASWADSTGPDFSAGSNSSQLSIGVETFQDMAISKEGMKRVAENIRQTPLAPKWGDGISAGSASPSHFRDPESPPPRRSKASFDPSNIASTASWRSEIISEKARQADASRVAEKERRAARNSARAARIQDEAFGSEYSGASDADGESDSSDHPDDKNSNQSHSPTGPTHRRHLAEGILAGVVAAEILSGSRKSRRQEAGPSLDRGAYLEARNLVENSQTLSSAPTDQTEKSEDRGLQRGRLADSPPLRAMEVNLTPSPSPPPAPPLPQVSPDSSPGSYDPDAMLVSPVDGGKRPEIARSSGMQPLASGPFRRRNQRDNRERTEVDEIQAQKSSAPSAPLNTASLSPLNLEFAGGERPKDPLPYSENVAGRANSPESHGTWSAMSSVDEDAALRRRRRRIERSRQNQGRTKTVEFN